MAFKPRYKRRIFWTGLCIAGVAALAIVFVPPMINLNSMKPRLESAIVQRTGIPAKINGDINFSLLGHATIVAHDVSVSNGKIKSTLFAIPLREIFNLENAKLSGQITVYGARIDIQDLSPIEIKNDIAIYNSTVRFLDKDYDIIRGRLSHGQFAGTVRTNQHKYEIEFDDDEFIIKNHSNKLEIIGRLYSDGSARGELAIDTNNINRWFEFDQPRIDRRIDMTTNFEWDGKYGFDFSNIRGNGFSGNIQLMPDGARKIQLAAKDVEYDFSFLTRPGKIFFNTAFDLDFYGHMKLAGRTFDHLKINAVGTSDALQIGTIVADRITLTGGRIDANGAHDIMITMPLDGRDAMCLFSGTPQNWKCREFTYGDMHGSLSVDGTTFNISVTSDSDMPSAAQLRKMTKRLGKRGTIIFQFRDAAGTINVSETAAVPSFTFARNKTLSWINPGLNFIPQSMMDAPGDFEWNGRMVAFEPYDRKWRMSVYDGHFYIAGDNFKEWLPGIDLDALNNLGYIVSGDYKNGNISNLEIKIAGHTFTGNAVGDAITLKTDTLDLDSFVNQNYIDNYEELSFLGPSPIMIPFDVPVRISMAAATLIYNGNEYKNFIYALKPNSQTFSIADRARGNMLATIERNKNNYDISVQLNRFAIQGALLSSDMPLNIRDTLITAEINMTTSGQIAHDITYNLRGDVDMSFDGGYLIGMGIDEFYGSAENITRLNAEYALSDALDGGETQIKKMHITGKYADGNFATTAPITLSMRHTDATGALQIQNHDMTAQFYLVLRGTAPAPAPIDFEITSGAVRNYSLSEIMRDFDASFLRHFVKTHNRF